MNKSTPIAAAIAVTLGVLVFFWPRRAIAVPAKAGKLEPYFRKWSSRSGIPIDILLAWAKNESDYKINEYNPERGVMARWAHEVADHPDRWGRNPDYAKAVAVRDRLDQGADPMDISVEDWTFGSYGLFQVSRITAAEAGCLAPAERNTELYDIDRNFGCACAVIRRKAEGLGLSWRPASYNDATWAKIRAAYVMGVAGAAKAPERAASTGGKLVATLRDIRAARA